jgi:hypothetical protein
MRLPSVVSIKHQILKMWLNDQLSREGAQALEDRRDTLVEKDAAGEEDVSTLPSKGESRWGIIYTQP